METFGCGDIVISASSIKQGEIIVKSIFSYREKQEYLKFLKTIKYGHKFDWDRKCWYCKIYEKDYKDNPQVCKIGLKKYLDEMKL